MNYSFIKTLLIISSLLPSIVVAQTCKDYIPDNNPDSRYTNHNDGTVTDNDTGLMWKQCVEGVSGIDSCTTGTATTYTWQQALQLPSSDTFAGYSDWRLPNLTELESLVTQNCFSPSININLFPNTPASVVWSSSPYTDRYKDYLNIAWSVYFSNGYTSNSKRDYATQVRLVRSRH